MTRYFLNLIFRTSLIVLLTASFSIAPVLDAIAATPAKKLFGAKRLPVVMSPASYGFYSKGCLAGGIAMPHDGATWEVMRPSRNRRWGHPNLVRLIERLSIDAKKNYGWNGLMVGDLSQPRGGPMLTGHASHQVGLDADIWLRPMPARRWTRKERNSLSAISVLKKGTVRVNNGIWTKAHEGLIKTAAQYREVQRIFVHPGIKKKLCNTVKGDRRWLNKVRPYWGHHYHMHVRLRCQPGSTNCKRQASTGSGTGCDKTLEWWFKVAFAPKKNTKKKKTVVKKKKKKKKKVRRYKIMADLPSQCRTVLAGPNPVSIASVTLKPRGSIDTLVASNKAIVSTGAAAIAASAAVSPAINAVNSVVAVKQNVKDFTIPTPKPSR